MSEHDNQVPGALVAVGTKALAVRSATLIKRGLALVKSLDPGDAGAHFKVGRMLYAKGDQDGAIAEYRTAIRLQPDDAEVHHTLGVALRKEGRVSEGRVPGRVPGTLFPLFYQTFGDFETTVVNGEETGVFKFDLERVKSVMGPIANAIYFKDYGEGYVGKWNVFITSLKTREDLAGQPNQWQPFRDLLGTLQFGAKPVPQPAIFRYAVCEIPGGIVFEFIFYGAFISHCFGPRPGKTLTV